MGCCFSQSVHPIAVATLRQVAFVSSSLDEDSLVQFARLFEVFTVAAGEMIYELGDMATGFYIIATGEVEIKQGRKNMMTSTRYHFFGEEAFIDEDATRPVTVTAKSDVTLLHLSRDKFQKLVRSGEKWVAPIRAHARRVSDMMKLQVLKKIPFLRGVDANHLLLFASLLRYRIIEAGYPICRESEMGNEFYIIAHGSAIISKMKAGREVKIMELTDGAYFGEISLVESTPRTATVVAWSQTTVLCLMKEHFENFLELAPTAKKFLVSQMQDRTVKNLMNYDIPLFQSLGVESVEHVAQACKVTTFAADEVVFQEGDKGEAFYILLRGDLQVTVKGAPVRSLKAGDYFGELALVTDDNRTATVICVTDSVLIELSKKDFQTIMSHEPAALAEVELRTLKSDVQLFTILNHPHGANLFSKALEKDYSIENIRFWQAADMFRILHGGEIRVGRGESDHVPHTLNKPVSGRSSGRTIDVNPEHIIHEEEVAVVQELFQVGETQDLAACAEKLVLLQKVSSEADARRLILRWDRRQLAKEIFNKFVSVSAAMQVNINHDTRNHIEQSVQMDYFPIDMFVQAQSEIYQVMREPFFRFKGTDAFSTLLRKVGVYEESNVKIKMSSQHSQHDGKARVGRLSTPTDGERGPFSILAVQEESYTSRRSSAAEDGSDEGHD